jgi:hypothetical protein
MPTPLDDGTALFDVDAYTERRNLAGRFVVPPLTVIDQAQGYMRQRRTQWEAAFPDALGRQDFATRDEAISGRSRLTTATDDTSLRIAAAGPSVSVFDPTIAEIAYEWWTAPGDLVYDPFSGGPTRGIVATALGRRYLGVDVRDDQVTHNRALAEPGATYVHADSTEYLSPPSDFVFSCPPYGSLERYSDQPDDLSTLSWPAFCGAYREVIELAVYTLRPDRFAAFMVGNYKEKRQLRDLVGLTVEAFVDAGAEYFADIVTATSIGSSSLQAAATFPINRRPMPRHQMLLVFAKGDARAAADRITAAITGDAA